MQQDVNQFRIVRQKIIVFPDRRPGQHDQEYSEFEQNEDDQDAQNAVHWKELALAQYSDAFADVTVVNVHRVDLLETLQRSLGLAGQFLRHAQVILQRQDGFQIEAGCLQRAFVPERRDFRLTFLHESQSEQRTTLHRVADDLSAIVRLRHLLELADRFF